jgi:hypothetical protein
VSEISDPIHWDLDGLGVLDPKQVAYILDLVDGLRDYGLDVELFRNAFFYFKIEGKLKGGLVKLARTEENFLEAEDPLFALPNVMDEDKGPYADFIDHITRLRVKLLNDLIEFEQKFSVDEIEEDLREHYQREFFEGRAIHVFRELTDILEYVPEGYSLDANEENKGDEEEKDLDQLEVEEVDTEGEWLEEDETMRWEDEGFEVEGEKDEKSLDGSSRKGKSGRR